MMMVRNRSVAVMMLVAAMAATGCDPDEPLAFDEQGDLQLRECNTLGGCGSTDSMSNTFFLGERPQFPFWYLPRSPGSDPTVQLSAVETERCELPNGALVGGEIFSTLAPPTLTVDDLGRIGPIELEGETTGVTCRASGELLVGSRWYLSSQQRNEDGVIETVDAELSIEGLKVDELGRHIHTWHTNLAYLRGDMQVDERVPTCNEAEAVGSELSFSAMLYSGLRVDDQGIFSSAPDAVLLACLSGTVGKTGVVWGYDQTDPLMHQVVSSAARAAYCGGESSYTQANVQIGLHNLTGVGPHLTAPSSEEYELEAVWKAPGEAICVGKTRLAIHQPLPGDEFECPSEDGAGPDRRLPVCDPEVHLVDPEAMFATHALR